MCQGPVRYVLVRLPFIGSLQLDRESRGVTASATLQGPSAGTEIESRVEKEIKSHIRS